MLFPILFFVLLGCFTSWIVVHLLLTVRFGQTAANSDPQHHHTHTGFVPRIGGVGIISGLAVTYLLCYLQLDANDGKSLIHYAIFGGAVASFILGLLDDFKPLGARVKLLAQIIIAMVAHECGLSVERITIPFSDISLELGIISIALTVGWFIAIMNLINLIDGLDGLAGGIGLMLMILIAYLGLERGGVFSTVLALGMVGAILGFLFHNFPPAKVYMGDSGAYMIGYVIAALSLLNSEKGTILAALIAPVLALALPIADVSYAILRRGIKGLPLFRPDQNHIHHKLLRSGLSHRNTVLVLYAISLAALIGGLLVFANQGRYLPIFFGFSFVVILFTLRGQKISIETVRSIFTESLAARQDTRNALQLRDWLTTEAERADSGEHLWLDMSFVFKKMGFCSVELEIEGQRRSYDLSQLDLEDTSLFLKHCYLLRDQPEKKLTLYASRDNFSTRQFAILADLATEALVKAVTKWKEVNGVSFDFDTKAKDPADYHTQKARNLYRPAE
ncbi:MAG: MraY family glycosyltransferase [Verrucomicrobiota bacterium]